MAVDSEGRLTEPEAETPLEGLAALIRDYIEGLPAARRLYPDTYAQDLARLIERKDGL